MLKRLFTFSLFIFAFNAFACMKVEGSLAVDGEVWKMSSKVESGREYIFPLGPYIFKMTVKDTGKKSHNLMYVVHEKRGTNLSLITKGEEENIDPGKVRDIYAKGEEGQPNSIITVKLTNI